MIKKYSELFAGGFILAGIVIAVQIPSIQINESCDGFQAGT
jgi:hypothetical protein